ncbi:MAG TPA: HAMP domain-containing sensor histidine kinase [Burkholderiales bacterium]|nr:HAMP domain-containing sensor histidine kinase [Burkholderiales bacterium]
MRFVSSVAHAGPIKSISASYAAVVRSIPRPQLSLRVKSMLAFGALVLYLVAVAAVLQLERGKLRETMNELTNGYRLDEVLAQAQVATSHSILGLNDAAQEHSEAAVAALLLDVRDVEGRVRLLQSSLPSAEYLAQSIDRATRALTEEPSSAALADMRDSLYRLSSQIALATAQLRARQAELSARYERIHDSISWMSLVLGMIGIGVFGALITLFFTRLTADIKRLQHQAAQIVEGKRGSAMPVTRGDELGKLMAAVNGMAAQLAERDRALELSRRNYAHQEKMAAIGSLAAGIAHEIGNPIAAIAGIAHSICDVHASSRCAARGAPCQPGLILEQTQRIASITREISEFASPKPAQPALIDLNALLRSTCSFVRYDRRYRHIQLRLDLDKDLPAIVALADKIVQLAMNLLINAADALETVPRETATVSVRTRKLGSIARFSVEDNGSGMSEDVMRRAFEPFFTTKPSGKGTGLGLPLCRSLVEEMGGTMGFDSSPGKGTLFYVDLPLPDSARLRSASQRHI